MDLNQLPQGKVALVTTVVEYDDEGVPTAGFRSVGSNSDEYQQAERDFQIASIKKSAARGHGLDARSTEDAEELTKALRRQEKTLVYGCIKEMFGFTDNGQPVPLSTEALDRIFAARPTWIGKILADIRSDRPFTKP